MKKIFHIRIVLHSKGMSVIARDDERHSTGDSGFSFEKQNINI
jgi:hypothetical protein